MLKGAIISDCKKYRYKLWRIWDESKPLILWCMHNPSTADEYTDDPTIRRIISFSKDWGYGGLYVCNLSPYRATNPKEMIGKSIEELLPIQNMFYINEMKQECSFFMFAYGNSVVDIAPNIVDRDWHCLGITKSNNPKHPLYIKSGTQPILFKKSDY